MDFSTIIIKKDVKSSEPTTQVIDSVQILVESLVGDFFAARTALHNLHLIASRRDNTHKTLKKAYELMVESGDSLAENFSGCREVSLSIPDQPIKQLNTTMDAIDLLKEIKGKVTAAQNVIPESEIVNMLDETKSGINSVIYFLVK